MSKKIATLADALTLMKSVVNDFKKENLTSEEKESL